MGSGSGVQGSGEAATLAAKGLDFGYGPTLVVQGVSCEFRPGQVAAVVGPNGCGKSTLLRLMCGQLRPRDGQVTVGGRNVAALSAGAVAQRIALVPQNTSVGFAYTVRQMVLMARWPRHAQGGLSTALGFETAYDHQLAEEAMWTTDVHHLADRPVTELSGGERQRVIVARALAQQTPALLLDEPTSALDLWHQLELLHHLRLLAARDQKLVVLVTHDLNLALQYADRVVVMDAGRIVADGPPETTLTPAVLEGVYQVKVERIGEGRIEGGGRLLGFARRDEGAR